jgi:hypothetical protein
MFSFRSTLLTVVLMWSGHALAQGDGPRTNFLTPVGLESLAVTWVRVDSNFRFGQSEVPGDADLETRTAILVYAYRFPVAGRFSQFTIAGGISTIRGIAKIPPRGTEDPGKTAGFTRTGFTDPRATWRVGLHGAPALDIPEWQAFGKGLQVYGQVGISPPLGKYDRNKRFNTGRNRWSLDLKFPLVIPVDGAKRRTFLEITPGAAWFSDNDEPFGAVDQLEQEPLYQLELHATHELSNRLWLSGGFQYQHGGRTIADGVPDDNELNQWLGEVSFGYIPNRTFALLGSYGRILEFDNDTRGDMLRLRLVAIF